MTVIAPVYLALVPAPEHPHMALCIHEDEAAESDDIVDHSVQFCALYSVLPNHRYEAGQKGGLTVSLVADRLDVEHPVMGKGYPAFEVYKGVTVLLLDAAMRSDTAVNEARLFLRCIGLQFMLKLFAVHRVKHLLGRSESESVWVANLAFAKYIIGGQSASRGLVNYDAHVFVVLMGCFWPFSGRLTGLYLPVGIVSRLDALAGRTGPRSAGR